MIKKFFSKISWLFPVAAAASFSAFINPLPSRATTVVIDRNGAATRILELDYRDFLGNDRQVNIDFFFGTFFELFNGSIPGTIIPTCLLAEFRSCLSIPIANALNASSPVPLTATDGVVVRNYFALPFFEITQGLLITGASYIGPGIQWRTALASAPDPPVSGAFPLNVPTLWAVPTNVTEPLTTTIPLNFIYREGQLGGIGSGSMTVYRSLLAPNTSTDNLDDLLAFQATFTDLNGEIQETSFAKNDLYTWFLETDANGDIIESTLSFYGNNDIFTLRPGSIRLTNFSTEEYSIYNVQVPEPLTILGTVTAASFGYFFKRQLNKKKKKSIAVERQGS